jgi:hypothetical protein
MSQKQLLLDRETALLLTIAMLRHDMGLLQARLLRQEHDALLQQTEAQHQQTVAALLLPYAEQLPVPVEQCTFDPERGCLAYDAPAG